MRRYKSASGNTSSGTFSIPSRGAAISWPSSPTIMPPMTATTTEVCTALCTASRSPRPIACAMTTLQPMPMPMKRFMISPMTELFAPTAATAMVFSAPVKLPTTAMSAALKSCPSIAVAATGRANCGSLFQIGPFSISSRCLRVASFIYIINSVSKISPTLY